MNTYGYLVHHGIKGQKWGIRRYQNPDGSLTAEGRARYGISEHPDYRKNFEDVKKSNPNNNDISGYSNALLDQSKVITDIFKDYTDSAKKDYENNLKDPKLIDKCINYLKSSEVFGGGYKSQVDDPEMVDMAVQEFLSWKMPQSNKTKEYAKAFRDCVDDYRNSAERFVKDIVGNLENETIKTYEPTRSGLWMKAKYKSYKDTVKDILLTSGDGAWVRYLNNHEEMAYDPYGTVEEAPKDLAKLRDDFINKAIEKYKQT